VLIRIDEEAGHGLVGSTRDQQAREWADEFAFLLAQLGEPGFAAARPQP
jgi:prolyl oligopeptidase PreP (S9A serine peptidase family)